MPELAALSIYQKLIRIARSSSGDDEKAKAMFVLFSLLALQGKITMIDTMAWLRGEVFSGIHRVDIFHTGHHFYSTEPRPVFTVSPNVFCKMTEERVLYLPLAHNLALKFYQYPEHGFSPHWKLMYSARTLRNYLQKTCHESKFINAPMIILIRLCQQLICITSDFQILFILAGSSVMLKII